ncbi:MAG: hypothetical protein ACREOH_08900, partial [Candidatus Entotheonellia bacterium]
LQGQSLRRLRDGLSPLSLKITLLPPRPGRRGGSCLQTERKSERTSRELGKTIEAHYCEGAPHPIPFQSPTDVAIQQQAIALYRSHLLSGLRPRARG